MDDELTGSAFYGIRSIVKTKDAVEKLFASKGKKTKRVRREVFNS